MKWLPWIIFLLFGYFLVSNNFASKLGIIDDHEIPMFMGSDGKVSLSEIPSAIMSTEVGKWGEALRYRPSYYTLRVLETALWGDNAMLWYLTRYLILVAGMYLGWRIMTIYLPKIVSYLFIFYLLTIPFWSDLLSRLGPSEIYGVVAIPLFVYGMIKHRLWMITLGYMIAVGAKENFLILFPILLLYVGYRVYRRLISPRELIGYLILSLYTIFIVAGIQIATSKSGADVYGEAISYSERFATLYKHKRYIIESRHLQLAILVYLAGFISVLRMVYVKGIKAIAGNTIANHLGLGAILGLSLASQYIFYNNQIPTNIRYDFPAMLLFPIIQLVAVSLLIKLLPKKIWLIKTSFLIYLILIVGMLFMIGKRGYSHIQAQTQKTAISSQKFDQVLNEVYTTASQNPDAVLVYVSEHYFSFEPIISVGRYLSSKRIENVMILSYTRETGLVDPLGKELEAKFLSSMEGTAGEDDPFARFAPSSEMRQTCFSITFGKAEALPECPLIGSF